jgi:hypothetical protein
MVYGSYLMFHRGYGALRYLLMAWLCLVVLAPSVEFPSANQIQLMPPRTARSSRGPPVLIYLPANAGWNQRGR